MRMTDLYRAVTAGLVLMLLAACSTERPDPAGQKAYGDFALERYFTGHVQAWGLFEPRFGGNLRQFTVDVVGRQENGNLVLTENFRYSDGETQQRIWTIRPDGPDRYLGTADDVIGTAIGHRSGNSLHWTYDLNLKTDDGRITVSFEDWLYRFDDRTLLNRATVTKFGVRVGDVTLAFHKIE